jgi:hypothetical protein
VSTRSRSRPWFRERRSMAEIERSAQIYYGWHDWNDPFQAMLNRAASRFIEYSWQPAFVWDASIVVHGRPL